MEKNGYNQNFLLMLLEPSLLSYKLGSFYFLGYLRKCDIKDIMKVEIYD